jgi:cyclopropane fatty-acyl-phospholipid synthase-like methyltransferase
MPKMTSASTRHFGKVFDGIATEYDRHRPGYPDELIDHACQIAELENGDEVLELGCGSGQLTCALVARGFHVTALEPGEQLIMLAEKNVGGPGMAEFVNAKFEDAVLPEGHYKAIFCASAFHWIDPGVSWRKTAELLAPGGVLALMQYFGLSEQRTSGDLDLLLAVLKKAAPEIAASWPHYYELDEIIDGAKARHQNISDVWAWLGNYDLAQDYVGNLFKDTEIAAVPNIIEQTADELIALFRTTSPYGRLSGQQRDDLENGYKEIYKKLGRPIRSSTVRVLAAAKRRSVYNH